MATPGRSRRPSQAFCAATARVLVLPVEEAESLTSGTDLLVVGGPTEGHAATPAVAEYLDRLASTGLSGVAASAFDTRLRWPRWLSGSAASDIATRLRQAGARVIQLEASFFVTMRRPVLVPRELERAAAHAGVGEAPRSRAACHW